MTKFIKITDWWYVRADNVHDVWLSTDNLAKFNNGYNVPGKDRDFTVFPDEKAARETLERVVSQLNGTLYD